MVEGAEMIILPLECRTDPMEDVPVLQDATSLGLDFLAFRVAPNRIIVDAGGMGDRSRQQGGQQGKRASGGDAQSNHVRKVGNFNPRSPEAWNGIGYRRIFDQDNMDIRRWIWPRTPLIRGKADFSGGLAAGAELA